MSCRRTDRHLSSSDIIAEERRNEEQKLTNVLLKCFLVILPSTFVPLTIFIRVEIQCLAEDVLRDVRHDISNLVLGFSNQAVKVM